MEVSLKIDQILVPIDFSDSSRKAFYIALKFARQFNATTHVLHVMEPIASFDSGEDMDRQAGRVKRVEEGVQRRVNDLFEAGGLAEVDRRKVKVEIRAGKPYMEILKYGYQNDVDLI
ncbi:MAG: universal stress protein, partial [Deltaproteobacteria bacterium]|nr:universal stress protein [Deltaproteobacteria bacterium]